ncbi:MAG: hypothetical protein U0807_02855 [Candidatus Binatia bacterium]
MSVRKWMVAAGLSVVLVAGPARADEYANEAGWGALAAVANLGYMPAKLAYAGIGGLTGGLAWLCTFGDTQTAEAVWEHALGGTYVLTPRMMRGDDSIAFVGADRVTEVAAGGATAASPRLQESTLGSD